MADIAVTAANVAMHAAAPTTEQVTAGATITQGQVLYKDSADSNKYKLAINDDTEAKAAAVGIALTPGDANDKIWIAKRGAIDVGGALTVGEIYCLSDTAGGIAPEADVDTADMYVTILGVASAADQLELNISATGIQIPT